ncbi:membrane protein [Opitutaceae bacterium TAV5]|nr:membrane protein [Opitutaceae bacterium TAV5]
MNPLLGSLVASACLGAQIGLIRQWSDQQTLASLASGEGGGRPPIDFGGVRTFSLWGLLGCMAAWISDHHINATLPVVMTLVGLHLLVAHFKDTTGHSPGGTSFAASMLTCLIGALINWGYTQGAILATALTMVMLGVKQPLHRWTSAFTAEDMRATLQFAAITGVILPLVPDRDMGPFNAINPYATWMMVVLISGVGFLGYVLMRFLGANAGITITGLVGGLASSTATTLTFAKRSKDMPALGADYSLAVILACVTMCPRFLVMAGLVDIELVRPLLVPMALMALPGLAYAGWIWWGRRHAHARTVSTPAMKNPLNLKAALQFAVLYAVAAFLVKACTELQWQDGVLPLSFLSGLTSPDAIVLLMANNHHDGTATLALAVKAIVLASVANNVGKAGIAIAYGAGGLPKRVTWILAAMSATGLAGLFFV